MKKNVLVIGELNVDMILNQIPNFPKIGTEILADEMTLTLGSSSAIFASNLSSQELPVSFLGLIGKDQFGTLVLDSLKKNKVETKYIVQSEEHKTGVTVVMNYGMDRAMVTHCGAMNHLSIEHIKTLDLSIFTHVHISSIFLQPKIKEDIQTILELFKEKQITTSLDPQWDPAEDWDLDLKSLLPLVDVFLPNIKEFQALTQASSIQEGIDSLNSRYNVIAIKDGENGASLYKKNNEHFSKPAFLNEDVVDCIGAGDSFDAGFIYGYVNEMPLDKCLERGNIMGAINTSSAGGTSAFQDYNQTKIKVLQNFNYKL